MCVSVCLRVCVPKLLEVRRALTDAGLLTRGAGAGGGGGSGGGRGGGEGGGRTGRRSDAASSVTFTAAPSSSFASSSSTSSSSTLQQLDLEVNTVDGFQVCLPIHSHYMILLPIVSHTYICVSCARYMPDSYPAKDSSLTHLQKLSPPARHSLHDYKSKFDYVCCRPHSIT